jgi:hypothetical protein
VAAGGQLTPNLVVIGGLRTDNQDCVGFLPPPALLNFGLSFRPVLGPISLPCGIRAVGRGGSWPRSPLAAGSVYVGAKIISRNGNSGLATKNAACSPISPERLGNSPFKATSAIAMVPQ